MNLINGEMKYRISTFIGDSYSKLKRYKEAIKYYDDAVKLIEAIFYYDEAVKH